MAAYLQIVFTVVYTVTAVATLSILKFRMEITGLLMIILLIFSFLSELYPCLWALGVAKGD